MPENTFMFPEQYAGVKNTFICVLIFKQYHILLTMKILKPVWGELSRSRPSDVVSKFMNFYKICFLSWHRAGSGQASPAPGPWPRRGKWSRHYVGSRTKNCWTEPGQHRNYRLSSRHIFSSFHSQDSTLGATQLLFFIRPCLLYAGLRIKFVEEVFREI